ncbi:electron transfer flavoprotein subunit alpha/FixB family protein [Arthrobacter sp. H5]|uniref:electron transfer flavoprotein subunit alpha/FixB family protein n=1 Tax=Arthrobacter sp. H5 TaxID=1267973 RepID=UPI0004864416|nr:electron transfer flavoprotein subunit alpha/FixB family protein [Arthrobacter sp. H5]
MATVLVFIDNPGESLHKADRELLTLAATLGEPAVALSGGLSPLVTQELGAHGAVTVYQPADLDVEGYLVASKAAFLAAAAEESGAEAVLLGNSFEGKEVAARAGVRLGSGVITDAVAVDAGYVVTKSVLAGSYTVTVRVTTGRPIITVKPNSIEAAEPGNAGSPPVLQVRVAAPGKAARITGRSGKTSSGRPELDEARVIVAGGRGVNGDFGPIEELADVLGGAVGASRAATDAGWIEHSAQVGQTGKTVSPQLYISVGISGAIQQKSGMQTAKVIVAVNQDADSPVFEIADFGVVGDLFAVLPQATAEIRKRRG